VSASYDPSLSTPKDQVRFRIRDTNVTPVSNAKLSDEEIEAMLMLYDGNVMAASIACAQSIAFSYAGQADTTVGDVSVRLSQIATRYSALASELSKQVQSDSRALAVPFTGGISIADKQTRDDNADRVQPAFVRDRVAPRFCRERW
jgi:hypothetical protein